MTREQALANINAVSELWASKMKARGSEEVFAHYADIANECQMNYRLSSEVECNWPEGGEETDNPVIKVLMQIDGITDKQYEKMVDEMGWEGLSYFCFETEGDEEFYAGLIMESMRK